jgi:hypothetical protein
MGILTRIQIHQESIQGQSHHCYGYLIKEFRGIHLQVGLLLLPYLLHLPQKITLKNNRFPKGSLVLLEQQLEEN